MDKKILIVHIVVDVNGGIGSVVMNMINYQLKKGYNVGILYSQYYAPFFNDLDRRVICYHYEVDKFVGSDMLRGLNINKFYREIKSKHKNEKIIIHAHNVATIGLFADIRSIPLICTIHGISRNGVKSIRGMISNLIYKLILHKMQHYKKKICAVSYDTATYYQNFIPKYKIITIHNGVRISNIVPKTHEKFVIGHVGDISYSKGWDTTFNAYLLLPEELKNNIEFKFAGKILDISKNKIDDLIKRNALQNKAIYLGQVPNASNTVIPELDVLILASISEGLPMVVIEAQGRGIPVIATNVGGIKEVIKDGVNGFLVEKNSEKIKDKIIEMYQNGEEYESMRINSLKIFNNEFTVERMGDQYDLLYNAL